MRSACPGSGTRYQATSTREWEKERERERERDTRARIERGARMRTREKDREKGRERQREIEREREEEHVQDFVNERPWDCRVRARARVWMKEKPRERECFVSIKEERMREWSEWEILEWRASGNLRSCDRYKRNIFLFPGIYLNA